MSTNRFGLIFCSTVLFAAVAFGAHSYENDFATRMSGAVPDGRWHEMPYVVGSMAKDINSSTFSYTAIWSATNTDGMQDNWREVRHSDNQPFTAEVKDEDGEQYLGISTTSSADKTFGIAHAFGNSFTDGVVRMSFDFRCLPTWTYGGGYLKMQPLMRAGLKRPDSFGEDILFNFGFQANTQTEETRAIYGFYDETRSAGDTRDSVGTVGASLTIGNWYRLSADMDVGEGRISAVRLYDLGTGHPTLSTDPGTPIWSVLDKNDRYTKAVVTADNPVEGFAFRVKGISRAAANVRCVDNIVCSWQAPGTDGFEDFYVNDFTKRRCRALSPAGTETHGYVRDQTVSETSCADYSDVLLATETEDVDSDNGNLMLPTSTTAIGYAGWRRSTTGKGEMTTVKFGGSSAMLRARTTGAEYVIGTQTLGERVTSGIVRMSYDFRTPDKWYWNGDSGYRYLYAGLGNASLYGKPDSVTSCYAARFGMGENTKTVSTADDFKVFSHFGSSSWSDAGFKSNYWYRGIFTVDLTGRKCTGKLYKLGTSAPSINKELKDTDLVYECSADTVANDLKEIESFALVAYGVKNESDSQAYFDNVQVWKDWNEAAGSGTLLYRDSFSSLKRYFSVQTRGETAGALQMDDGQDHWVRRGYDKGERDLWITSGDNPCLASASSNGIIRTVHPLGLRMKRGEAHLQVDIRPPRRWSEEDSYALVSLGDDFYLQGNVGRVGTTCYSNHVALTVGFGKEANVARKYGSFSDVRVRYTDGNDIAIGDTKVTAGNWYRFRVTYHPAANTYDLAVYDIGATHPESADSGKETLFKSWTGIPCFTAPQGGLSALGISVKGNLPLYPGNPDDEGAVLFDNVRAWDDAVGTAIILR